MFYLPDCKKIWGHGRCMKVSNKGFNYSQDGPGNRLVYHLQGCNMCCPWCANPESISPEGSFLVYKDKLIDSVCPHDNIKNGEICRQTCHSCAGRECLKARRSSGIKFSCQTVSVAELISEAEECRELFVSGGGVTFTGGEPTLQFEELREAMYELKRRGISVAIETNASHPRLFELLPLIDVLIMDFKHYDSFRHKKYTGIANEQIKENLEIAMREHDMVIVRTPLIGGFNASQEDCKHFIEFYNGLTRKNTCFELLKFHEYGVPKWEAAGMEYTMQNAHISDSVKRYFEDEYTRNGLKITNT